MRPLAPVLGITLLLAGCFGGERPAPPPPRPRGGAPVTLNLPTDRATQACFADLARLGVDFSPLPDRDYGGGCRVVGAVQLLDIGVPVTGIKAMRCGLARSFVGWVRGGVTPAAREILGGELARIETYGSYACRNTIGTSTARLSGHGVANAVDVAGFVLRDGRRVMVEPGWHGGDPDAARFLEVVHRSACRRFGTVLGPDYNSAHRNHFHLEDDAAGFCR